MLIKLFIGRLLQIASWFFKHLEWVTHPGTIGDRIDLLVCRLIGHEYDADEDYYCYRCRKDTNVKRHCFRCGKSMEEA